MSFILLSCRCLFAGITFTPPLLLILLLLLLLLPLTSLPHAHNKMEAKKLFHLYRNQASELRVLRVEAAPNLLLTTFND